jgi:prepilin-type processing-associated H-X9-DG protein
VAKARVRSVAMNVYLGGWGGTDGGWGWANSWKIFAKTTEFSRMPASKLFVFQDVREDYIMYENFVTKMDGYSETSPNGALYGFYDVPGARHDGGTTLSFADGRAEIHHWLDLRTTPPIAPSGQVSDQYASPRNPDIAWLQERATRPK